MATPKRRSARLASTQRSTASPAPQLDSIVERDEPVEKMKPKQKQIKRPEPIPSSPMHNPSTPATATPVKLPMSEMHPSKVHPTMAPPSSGLRLGFVDIHPDQKSKDQPSGVTQSTPSKTPLPTSACSFKFDSELELGPEAKRMMEKLRGETARIKAELAAKREQERSEETELHGRRIAQAKGKASRFSAVHMAEFKKMDSIENHPSAYRANPDRITPLKTGIKRSQSRADLDEPDSVPSSKVTTARSTPKVTEKQGDEQESRIKRPRQRIEDDASTARPVSRDGSAIPRPKSSGNDSVRGIPRSKTLTSLMTPTKASLSRVNSAKTPTMTLVKSPSKPELKSATGTPSHTGSQIPTKLRVEVSGLLRSTSKKGFGGLTKSHTTSNLLEARSVPTHVQTPGRFGRVKSILKRQFSGNKPKTNSDAHDIPSPFKTPGPHITDKELPPIPLTTPGRKLAKHVEFTPQTKLVTAVENSPSPVKSGIPRSKTLSKLPTSHSKSSITIVNAEKSEGEISYPDLSAYTRDLGGETEQSQAKMLPPAIPNGFTFRVDHTIQMDPQPINGFGGAAGQASVRHVRSSNLFGSQMPGSFPRVPEVPKNEDVKDNKENADPQTTPTFHRGSKAAATSSLVRGIPHGMSNKKRSRATSDEEDEGAERGAKKQRKNPAGAPEGDALLAPRLVGSHSPLKRPTPSSTPSPRKKGGLSLSRLNMLARPKVRK